MLNDFLRFFALDGAGRGQAWRWSVRLSAGRFSDWVSVMGPALRGLV
jgi:hypothetical protein